MTAIPERVTVRMYQVGFGDCFLVTVDYSAPLDDGRDERHVLIDFGSTHSPWPKATLTDVAPRIAEHCGGKLDVIVVTHRHKDHLSGFALDDAAATIDGLAPSLVVRPWTEDPSLASDATAPTALDDGSRALVHNLRAAEEFAAETARRLDGGDQRTLTGQIAAFAADQVANAEAIARLDGWAQSSAASYVFYGSDSRITEFVPHIKVRVLGPPTVEQWPEMLRQRAVDEDEFWMLNAAKLRDQIVAPRGPQLDALRSHPIEPGPVSWLVDKLQRHNLHLLHRIVRSVDDALNNTSAILLFEIGDKRLLFPGDAQIENWSFALTGANDSEDVRSVLSDIDFYKVGHHGSRNATPKTLYNLWGSDPDSTRPMVSFMSTKAGVHGKTTQTAVPRETLVAALERRTALVTTDGLDEKRPFIAVSGPADGGALQVEL